MTVSFELAERDKRNPSVPPPSEPFCALHRVPHRRKISIYLIGILPECCATMGPIKSEKSMDMLPTLPYPDPALAAMGKYPNYPSVFHSGAARRRRSHAASGGGGGGTAGAANTLRVFPFPLTTALFPLADATRLRRTPSCTVILKS